MMLTFLRKIDGERNNSIVDATSKGLLSTPTTDSYRY
jgi:hypothetical protein